MTAPRNFDLSEEREFVLLNRASAPEVFVEGISQVMIGVPLTKIVFHSIIEPKDGSSKEIRKAVQTLSIPTIAAVELSKIITSLCKQSEGQLTEMAGNEFGVKLKELLSQAPVAGADVKKIERGE